MTKKTDVLIVGTGCSGLYCALKLPGNLNIHMITKSCVEESDSFLAQGGICMFKDESDYHAFFKDTLRAGHYENNPLSVELMIRSSRAYLMIYYLMVQILQEMKKETLNIQKKVLILLTEFFIMKILRVKKSRVSFMQK